MTQTASGLIRELKAHADPVQAKNLARFFKTAPGQYGHGDIFLGIKVPVTRSIVKKYQELPYPEIQKLLDSKLHEGRLAGVILLAKRGAEACDFYLKNASRINNWDLVDASAGYVVGPEIKKRGIGFLKLLAKSPHIWTRRISIISTFYETMKGNPKPTLSISKELLDDEHDLIHKAVGWMLREVGKRSSMEELNRFLEAHASRMPRTALRYAIERHSKAEREYYLKKK